MICFDTISLTELQSYTQWLKNKHVFVFKHFKFRFLVLVHVKVLKYIFNFLTSEVKKKDITCF